MTQAEHNLAVSSDEILLAEVAQQNPEALELLYDRHAAGVLGLIVRIVREQSIAEELLQETFWQVWQKAEQFQGSGSAAAWIYRVARNRSLDQLRRQQARPQLHSNGAERLDQVAAPRRASTDSQVERMWERGHVQSALAQIPDEQRVCLELAYFEGLTQQQIAEHTSTPLGTVKTRLRIGLNKLERLLRAAGYP
ncbi:sigma-70 family RNA polymerase sigma factor [bacterium]|nr:sigma-70 family RNA polymerase sigma factor [bacterium]